MVWSYDSLMNSTVTYSPPVDLTMLARFNHPAGTTASDETSCKLPCQHPSCWASQRRQEKGVPHKLPPIVSHKNTLNDETGECDDCFLRNLYSTVQYKLVEYCTVQ